MKDEIKYCGHCGTALVEPFACPATCKQCGKTSRTGRLNETCWGCRNCDSGGGPFEQRFCYWCGCDSQTRPKSRSLEQDEITKSHCIQNMLLIEVLKWRWALDTGNRGGKPSLDELDKYSRDAFVHEHPETGEKHAFAFWCPDTRRNYEIGDLTKGPRCSVFEHQMRED